MTEIPPDVRVALDAADDQFVAVSPDEGRPVFSALCDSFPFAYSSIGWKEVPQHVCRECSDGDAYEEHFDKLVAEYRLGDPEVYVFWGNMLTPALRLKLSAAVRHAVVIFFADFDTWIFPADMAWCFEAYAGNLCFGHTPGAEAVQAWRQTFQALLEAGRKASRSKRGSSI